jgi:phosphoribosylamine---glycine ligase
MNPIKVLLIGGGGREHALAWKLSQSPLCESLVAAPGNPGIADFARCVPLNVIDHTGVIHFVETEGIGLTVIGPEQPLVDGLADALRAKGHLVFGPSEAAARLEGSKSFSKDFMKRHGIPTAASEAFASHALDKAEAWISKQTQFPIVIKADGLAAGKGVFICPDAADATFRLHAMMEDPQFKKASQTIVIEEFMHGEEVSVFALCDGHNGVLIGNAQDHKRVGDEDTGLNTGGMGAYSPAPLFTADLEQQVVDHVLKPTLEGMRAEGNPYIGVLYMGLMITDEGPKVVEYNCRFGDPECQVLMPMVDEDLLPLLCQCAEGELKQDQVSLKNGFCCTVVMASKGYPEAFEKGYAITGTHHVPDNVVVFHSGTRLQDGVLLSNGGRVLCVTAIASSLQACIASAYQGVSSIQFSNAYYRMDIGQKGLRRLEQKN